MRKRVRQSYYKAQNKKVQSLIAANKITPHVWRLSEANIIEALNAQGYNAKKIKKISYLKHQISISYWDKNGGVCSGFFSYRIFARWQQAVERLVYNCGNTRELQRLSELIEYEYTHYPYPWEIQEAINNTVENCTCELTALESYKQTVRREVACIG
ncbi:hypothetical protein DSM106972_061740 [Dulcicalothrix desertica PCC 7102]|uniref:Uncharacterized protein n=1 Tax=Dulcicalothrix desertica PCC 7102 TaxID=232991 RepID=A0A433V7S6_9CYAN|nr:hypothetical protein [Dulcicalothrix desertica]RUT02099.1 hypothetical protein DSM106972_061740 [Dulcicalothrix desertica PCC 7102]TWH53744.1 hypothetical protein CAL7102_01724 [Dulcicalothrix desertica PCC 7102]